MAPAGRRLWLTSDGKRLVEDGDPDATTLFAGEGDEVSDEDAKRYGLKAKAPAANKEAEPAANKGGVTVTRTTRK